MYLKILKIIILISAQFSRAHNLHSFAQVVSIVSSFLKETEKKKSKSV